MRAHRAAKEPNDREGQGAMAHVGAAGRERATECGAGAGLDELTTTSHERTTENSAAPSGSCGKQPQPQPQQQQHVGPVMGIFFKVWSLVKVTKMRHNKLRRQTSDEAGHFQYISGEQLAAGASLDTAGSSEATSGGLVASRTLGAQVPRGPASLSSPSSSGSSGPSARRLPRDAHFRRAGSQPPAPVSVSASGGARALQAQTTAVALQQQSSTTNSSSSGVSSSASGTLTLARDKHQVELGAGPKPGSAEMAGARRRDDSQLETCAHQRGRGQRLPLLARVLEPRPVASLASVMQRMSQHEQQPATKPAGSTQGPMIQQQQQQQQTPQALDSGEDSDLNDIYSTPHDSIQSVPSSQLLLLDERADAGIDGAHERRVSNSSEASWSLAAVAAVAAAAERPRASVAFPFIKSLSTNNFPDARPAAASAERCGPTRPPERRQRASVDESPSSASSASSTSTAASARPLAASAGQKQPTAPSASWCQLSAARVSVPRVVQVVPEDQQRQRQQQQQQLNKSRFFISSSSSEESARERDSAATGNQLEQHQASIPIHLALHHHERAAARLLEPLARPVQAAGSGLVTGRPLVAAMSPDGGASSRHQAQALLAASPNCQLVGGVATADSPALAPASYRKSPSLFEMSQASRARFSARFPRPAAGAIAAPVSLPLASFNANYNSNPNPNPNPVNQTVDAGPDLPPVAARQLSSFLGGGGESPSNRLRLVQQRSLAPLATSSGDLVNRRRVPHSISLYDCKLSAVASSTCQERRHHDGAPSQSAGACGEERDGSTRASNDYKLARILLELGSNPSAKDQGDGSTALMLAIQSANLAAIKCLIEHGIDLDETNKYGLSALDLICSQPANRTQLEMFRLLIESGADFDRCRPPPDGTRLLDRLISGHHSQANDHRQSHQFMNNDASHSYRQELGACDKLAYIECLLHNGAKLGSSTWTAASDKPEIQFRLLRKLCQDGYFLYKVSTKRSLFFEMARINSESDLTSREHQNSQVEFAVLRFELALKRVTELEQQLIARCSGPPPLVADAYKAIRVQSSSRFNLPYPATTSEDLIQATHQLKYQTYLGLSRCERKRRFFKRALEYAHMTILIDSTSYEGHYSKAHILKDINELDDALIAIDKADRFVDKSIEFINSELKVIQDQEEAIVFDGCFWVHNPMKSDWIEASRSELVNNLDYLNEAKKHVVRLKADILKDKFNKN